MSVGLLGCAVTGPRLPPAIDLSAVKVPGIDPRVVKRLKAEPWAPKAPVTRAQTADYIDRLRLDGRRKRAAGLEAVELLNQCRAPLAAARDAAKARREAVEALTGSALTQ